MANSNSCGCGGHNRAYQTQLIAQRPAKTIYVNKPSVPRFTQVVYQNPKAGQRPASNNGNK